MILSDFVLREQNARAPCAAPPVELRSKWFVRDRRMDRGARLGANQGETEGPVSAEALPWQGVRMLVAAPQIVFGATIKFNNYHSQGMSKAKPAECRRARSPENRLQPPSAKHERRGGSPAAAGRFFGEKPPQVVFYGTAMYFFIKLLDKSIFQCYFISANI